jgi:hypothetical protein
LSSAVTTIVTQSYLPGALVLFESCRKHFPTAHFYCVVVDEDDLDRSELPHDFRIISGKGLCGGIGWERMYFQYSAFELCCALKPFALQYLANEGFENLIYLDSDILLFSEPQSLLKGLTTNSIVLTPHVRDWGLEGSEEFFFSVGVFNAGAVACRNDPTGLAFLKWWGKRLETLCCHAPDLGLFVDQKWLDLVPAMFPNVGILRSPVFNAGHWSLHSNKLYRNLEGDFLIADKPLESFHFTCLGSEQACDDHFNQWYGDPENYHITKEMVALYTRAINDPKYERYQGTRYPYSKFPDGTEIARHWQILYRSDPTLREAYPNPFDKLASQELYEAFSRLDRRVRNASIRRKFVERLRNSSAKIKHLLKP